MRYRIVIEVDTEASRAAINVLAEKLYDEAVTRYTQPVFCSTEKVEDADLVVVRS